MTTHNLIPAQTHGKHVDLFLDKTFAASSAASSAFTKASRRLLHPQRWHALSGKGTAAFDVLDGQLKISEKEVKESDFIRIDIPGPGPGAGNGYDWVKVVLIESAADHLGIKLMPCANPEENGDQPAHFFKEGSSSTLIVALEDRKLTASYHGRNEAPNNETGNVADNIRNTVIAAGALAGLSELQWKSLLKGLLEEKA
jgi:hypothetical protein